MHNDRILEPNMVVTVEPWAIIPGIGGPRHTDVIRVTETGHEFITTTVGGVLRTRDFDILSAKSCARATSTSYRRARGGELLFLAQKRSGNRYFRKVNSCARRKD